ncbi:MerR family transcriptional regulator [Nonomuraea sp. NPDC049750]|uniref:MerR family transcriptional regulator n=1 Tax=Nonomuraea sp. NPDC049750 TaxID=3154738 RepID=UPI0033DAF711
MQIGEAASASGVSVRSLRYYEDEGLIVPGRCSNGYRDYCQSTIDRVHAIRSLLEYGLPVRLVKAALPHLTDGPEADPDPLFLHEVESYRDRSPLASPRSPPSSRRSTSSCARPAGDHGLTLTPV